MTLNLDLFGQKNICFGEPKQGEIGDVRFVSVPILYGKERLTLMTDTCFSWGIQEEKGEKGYKHPILMVKKNMNSGKLEPTPHQSLFLKRFDEIVAACKKYCLANKVEIGRYDLEPSDLKKLGACLFVKKEVKDGKLFKVKNYSPTLYAQVRYNRKNKRVLH